MRNKIIIFGDSITYGAWDMKGGGWVNRLRLSIDRDKSIKSAHVFNMGISGQGTSQILARMDDECGRRIMDNSNIIVVIAAGINDARLVKGQPEISEEGFGSNVRDLIGIARKYTDNVLYVGLTRVDESRTNPVWWDRTMTWQNSRVEAYDMILRRICEEEGVEYIRTCDLFRPEKNYDGLHPSSGGHRKIAREVGKAVRRYIRK